MRLIDLGRRDTALDCIKIVARNFRGDLQTEIKRALIGCVVVTVYNDNQTYRIDHVIFDENPRCKIYSFSFSTKLLSL